MPRHFARKLQILGFVGLFVVVMILATLVSLGQVSVNSSAAPQLSAGQRATIPSEPANVSDAVVHRPLGKTKLSAASAQGNSLFLPAVAYQSGGYESNAVAIADVNGDGKPDLLVGDSAICDGDCGGGIVGVLLGNGDGTFQSAVVVNTGPGYVVSVAVADVNGDGKPDLIVANQGVSVLLGNGDGTFQPPVPYGLVGGPPVEPNSVVVADVNGDGKLDLLVSLYGAQVDVLLGNGDGTFQPAVVYGPGCCGQSSLAVADVNGDGKLDLIVTIGNSDSVGIMLGNGDGTFQPPVSYDSGGVVPTSVAVADVNGDGKLDLLVANEAATWINGFPSGPGSASVLLGNGDGTFQPAAVYSSGGPNYRSIAVADVNGDGKLDLLLAGCLGSAAYYCGGNSDGALGVLLGNGDGTFQPTVLLDSGGVGPISIAIADLNDDGKPDVALANWAGSVDNHYIGTVGVLLNDNGASATTTTTPVSSLNPSNYGQTVTFTATVSSASGTPTGTVIFYDSSTAIGSATLASGSAAISTSSLSVGSHSITAAYQGSGGFASSTSPVLTQIANGTTIATTTTLATSKNPGIYQQPVTFTATVSSASGTPTGTVVFLEDGHARASATLVNGSASFTTSTLARGKYAMTAAYLGSSSFAPSTSAVLEEWINLSGLFQSHIVLRGSGSPSLVGQPVTFTAYVTSKYGEIPDGDVVDFFTGDDGGLGSATTHNGQASITTSSLRAGVLTIFAEYEGDDDFHSSYTEQKQTVDKDPTTTTITASPNPAVYGQAVTYTATVTSSYGVLTGNVRISDIGLVPLVNGVATITKNLVRAGTHDVTASYQSDSHFARSTSAVYKEVVTPASTTTTLVSSANPSSLGQTVTFTATVTSSAGVNPFGTVTFTAGSTTLGTVALSSGAASIPTASLPEGSTLITATYNGADSFTCSSASLTQVVE